MESIYRVNTGLLRLHVHASALLGGAKGGGEYSTACIPTVNMKFSVVYGAQMAIAMSQNCLYIGDLHLQETAQRLM